MMKYNFITGIVYLLVLLLLLITTVVSAQIQITADECPVDSVGLILKYHINETPVSVNTGTTGGPQYWDFSTGSEDGTETLSIKEISLLPDYEYFPAAESGLEFSWDLPNVDPRYIYCSKTDTGFYWHGMKGTQEDSQQPYLHIYNTPRLWLKFPLIYENQWADTVTAEEEVQPGVTGLWTLIDEYIVDAYGTIKIPYQEEPFSCLRIRWDEQISLTVQGQPIAVSSSIDYVWITEDYGILARVESLSGETNPNFNQADVFVRLYDIIGLSKAPVANFTADKTMGQAPLTVHFTDLSTGNVTSWNWDFGDGGTSSDPNPAHTYNEAGTYAVSLQVTSPDGSDTEEKINYITVKEYKETEGWFWQNPLPQGNDLEDVFVFDENTAIAVGNAGTVMKTSDGGVNWYIQHYAGGATGILFSVHFINSNVGWAVGWDGTIIKTNDGGMTWSPQNSGTSKNLYSVYFIDANNGWAVGISGTIVHTSDGGEQWHTQSVETSEWLHSIHFINADRGWIVGKQGVIFHTNDGGKNWLPQDSGVSTQLRSVYFIDHNTGWIVGNGGTVLKTTNGGENWSPQQCGTGMNLNSVYFKDVNTGWITGFGFSILKTIDGGTNWIGYDSGTSEYLLSVCFFDLNVGWAVGRNGTIVKTIDGGINWEAQTEGITDSFGDTFFYDEKTGWAVGDDGIIIKTTDGGYNWSVKNSTSSDYLQSTFFVTENIGWAAGEHGTILYTTNGGEEWNVQQSGSDKLLYSIFFIDANLGWAVGSEATILKTENGGTVWNSQNSGSSMDLTSIYFIDENTGWVAGFAGTILKTENGGLNWTPKNSGSTNELNSIYFLNSNTGWVVGYNSILQTIDGGENWVSQYSSRLPFMYSVFFINKNTGWVVGGDGYKGYILKTTDGGMNWNEQLSNTANHLMSVVFTDANVGWIVGSYGTILKTTTGGEISTTEAPAANFTADRTTGQAPLTVQFTDLSTGDIRSWLWDFGDNQSSTLQHPSHTYQNPTSYTVSLQVSGAGGTNTKTATDYITVSEAGPYLTHDTGNLQVSIFENGNIGHLGITPTGDGVKFNSSTDALFSGGIIFGTASRGQINGHVPSFSLTDDMLNTVSISGFETDTPLWDQVARATFNDGVAPEPYGLSINQISCSQSADNGMIIQYRFYGNSTAMTDLYVGVFADWDIGGTTYNKNLGGYDASRGIAYQYVKGGENDANYYGIVALDGLSGARVTPAWIPDAARDSSFGWISTFNNEAITEASDYRMWIGSGPFGLVVGDTLAVGFAIVAGTDLNDLKASADAAIQKYRSFTSVAGKIDLSGLPTTFSMSQNYPNPFNPMTTMQYAVPKPSHVIIELFNTLGQSVMTLVDEYKQAGYYSTQVNAREFPSGIYIYRMKAGNFIQSRKMILMR